MKKMFLWKKKEKKKRVGVYYLGSDSASGSNSSIDNIPQVVLSKLDLGIKERLEYRDMAKKFHRQNKNSPPVTVLKNEDFPPGATESDGEDDKKNEANPFANIDINRPLRPEERLPVPMHHISSAKVQEVKKTKKTKKHHKEGKEKKSRSKSGETKKEEASLIDFEQINSPLAKPEPSGFEEVLSPPVEKEKHKKHKSKREKKETIEKAKPQIKEDVPLVKEVQKKLKPLCQDENISIIYELRVNPKQSKKIMAAFSFKNLSHEVVSNLEFTFASTMNIKISDQSSPKPSFVLQSGETNNHNIIFDINTFQQPQKLLGTVSYQTRSSFKKEFQLIIPVSSFIIPVKLKKEEFINILTEGGPYVLSSTQVHLKPEEDFRSFIVSLATLLHVELILLDNSASFYGKSIQGHNVAVYVKQLPHSIVSVDLKCTDGQIVNSLTNEVSNFFPRA